MLSNNGDSASTRESDSKLKHAYDEFSAKFGDIYTDGKKQTYESITARPNRCYYVGGASNNTSMVAKMGSILAPVKGNYRVEIPNACALGGAYKASWSHQCEQKQRWIDYDEYINQLFEVNSDLNKFECPDKWMDYLDGVGMLAKMEAELTVGADH